MARWKHVTEVVVSDIPEKLVGMFELLGFVKDSKDNRVTKGYQRGSLHFIHNRRELEASLLLARHFGGKVVLWA